MSTVLDALLASIRAAAIDHKDRVVPPAAILWTDEKGEFERLLPRGWPQLISTGEAQPREVRITPVAMTSRRSATPVGINRGHPRGELPETY